MLYARVLFTALKIGGEGKMRVEAQPLSNSR